MRILIYLIVIATMIVLLRKIFTRNQLPSENKKDERKFHFRSKLTNRHTWVQVYDTDSFDEIKSLQAHLEEEEIECFIYEQGRKDIHGNQLKGYGLAVPRTSVGLAQRVISRMPA